MSRPLQIAQISDCHVSADTNRDYRGINPHQNLISMMEKVTSMGPDLILATGDLSEDGSAQSYRLLQQYLHIPGTPVLALPGNHDDPATLAQAFAGSPVEGIAVTDHGDWQIIRLNSCIPDQPQGQVTEAALDELDALLSSGKNRSRLLAVHHHPVLVGNPWIDKYPLQNPQRLLKMLDRHTSVRVLLWGHIHHVFNGVRGATAMLGGPSTAINSLPDVQKFTADPAGPACRWLELKQDGNWSHRVIYL